jgi:hypothetical protein
VAVTDALDYLGREGVGVRRSRGGHPAFLAATGPVAGQFLHRTSRALDPHLHTHVVVANVAQGVDGAWSSVDSRRLHAHLGAAQSLYHARLRFELGDRMGASWELRPSGTGDVVGVEGDLRRLFSQRSASMDEYRHRRVGRGALAAPMVAAFHADRPEKDRSVTVDQLRGEWRQRAADLGFDLGDLTRAVGVHRPHAEPVIDHDRLRRQLVGLTREHRSVGRHHVVAAVAASTPGGAAGRDVETVVARLVEGCGQDRPTGPSDSTLGSLPPRWDPAQLVRTVDQRRLERATAEEDRPAPDGRTRSRSGIGIDGPPGRDHRVDGPGVMIHSLGLER